MTAPEEWAWLARIRHPQGRKGEVFADILTDFPERFSERRNSVAGSPTPNRSAPNLLRIKSQPHPGRG